MQKKKKTIKKPKINSLTQGDVKRLMKELFEHPPMDNNSAMFPGTIESTIKNAIHKDRKYIGFCPVCGDGVLKPFMFSIKDAQNNDLPLPSHICEKCGTLVSNFMILKSFVECIIKKMGGQVQ